MYFSSPLYQEDIRRAARVSFLPWESLQGESVLITGATGLIGTCLIDILMERSRLFPESPIEIYALGRSRERLEARFPDYLDDPRFHLLVQDIRSPLPESLSFTYMINGASNAHPAAYARDPVGTIFINIEGLHSLLSHAANHGTRRVLEVTSIEVYGQNRGDAEAFTEDYCGDLDCNTVRAGYPESKRVCEALCQAYRAQYGLSVTIARPSRVYGPTMLAEDNKAIAQFIHNVVQGEDIVLKSHGKQRYSYTYMLDVATAFLAVLLCGKDGEAYNVADEHSVVTLGGLAEAMARENGCQVVYDLSADTGAAGYSNLLNGVMDAEKLRALGWQAMVPLEEGVKKTIGILKASQ